MKTKLLYASLLFALACGPASTDSDSTSIAKASDDITSLDRMPVDRDQPVAPAPPVPRAPEAGDYSGLQTRHNAPPHSILSKPFFDEPDLGGTRDTSSGTANLGAGGSGFRRSARATPVQGNPGLYEVTLNNTGSGWLEKFLLYVPPLPVGQRAPLLVIFHKFGVSHWDAYYNTTFFDEARDRKWFAVAPLGATQASFSSLESQINVQAALQFVTDHYNVNPYKVYGVGFSMGGGSVTSFAARNIDASSGLMFAAIVNHTGGVSLTNTYASEYDDDDADDNTPSPGQHLEVPDILENWFGGPPSTHAFEYERASMIDLDPATRIVANGTDRSRNISHIPVLDWMASNDPLVYLRDQTTAFDTHVNGQNVNNTMTVVNANVHKWYTLDFHAACNWLSQFSLQLPSTASTLADQDGSYFWFQVKQSTGGAFTPFNWTVDSTNNRLTLWSTANLERLSVDATKAGLQYAGSLKLNLNTADGTGDQVLFENLPYEPASVTRDGVLVAGVWDPVAMSYLVDEPSNTTHMWRLNF
jgi:acetyl esterase/lipase